MNANPDPGARPSSRLSRKTMVLLAGIPLGLVASGVIVWQASYAAFTASTNTPVNNWTSGSVAVTNDHAASVLWDYSGANKLVPGDSDVKCVSVTYNGTVDLSAGPIGHVDGGVVFYLTNAVPGALGSYLQMSIERSDVVGNCTTTFGQGSSVVDVFNGADASGAGTTLTDLAAHSAWATGLSRWQPTASGQVMYYRIKWTLLDVGGVPQSSTTTAAFTWEAQSHS